MRKFSVIDLETDPFKFGRLPRAFAGCYFNGKTLSVFWGENCTNEIVRVCIEESNKEAEGLLIYAHNGGKFDFHFLLSDLLKRFDSSDIKILTIGARIVSLKCGKIEFRDSYAIIPKALRSFGAKKEIEIGKLESDIRESHKAEIIEYLKQDCVGLYEALEKFFADYGCGLTLASTTFKVLKKDFGIKPIRTNETYDERFRKFYYAGRVEFFSLGKHGEIDGAQRFKIIDINSAFPRAMIENHFFGADYTCIDGFPKDLFEQSLFDIVCDSNGALPMRKDDGGICFPVCRGRRFFITGWELKGGIDLGLIKNVRVNCCYKPETVQSFKNYVEYFYNMKLHARNPSERDFAKLFLNSLYGKFALNPREFKDVIMTKWGEIPEAKKIYTKSGIFKDIGWELCYDDYERGLCFWQTATYDIEDSTPIKFYNVATACSITGFVRAYLSYAMQRCKNVLYCDTDSLICSDTGDLILGEGLGEWKVEKVCDAVWIGGKKLYCAHSCKAVDRGERGEWKTASKGVRLSPEALIKVCEGESVTYSFDAPNYSAFSAPSFTTRTVRRDDLRQGKRIPEKELDGRD